jgi:tetratricopeptide (TPR) repeat protein
LEPLTSPLDKSRCTGAKEDSQFVMEIYANAKILTHIYFAIIVSLSAPHFQALSGSFSITLPCERTLMEDRHQASKHDLDTLTACEQAIRRNPDNARAYYEKGEILHRLNRYEEALQACEQAIHLDPTNDLAYYNKGEILYELQRYEEAVLAYEQALRLVPNDTASYNNKGYSLFKLQRYDEALQAYEQALRLDPTNGLVHYNKGLALDKLRRYEEATKAYQEAQKLGYI